MDEEIEEALRSAQERIEALKEQPQYDVIYIVNEQLNEFDQLDRSGCSMAALGRLNSDLDEEYHMSHTSVDTDCHPSGVVSVMFTVYTRAKKGAFENAEEVYLADRGNKSLEWCLRDGTEGRTVE